MRCLPALLLACSSPAMAQDGTQPSQIAREAERYVGEASVPEVDSPFALLSAIELNASEDGTAAAIRAGWNISTPGRSFHVLSLTAGAAVDKSEGSAFSALDPFANGAYLEGRYTFSHVFGLRDPGREGLAFCTRIAERKGLPAPSSCTEEYVLANDPDRIQEFRSLYRNNPTVLFAGVNGRVGRETFEFLDATTGSASEDTRTPWSVGGFVGVSYLPWRSSFAVEFRHQTRFKAGATAAVCPVPTGGVTVCPVGPVGPPTEREQNIFTAEYRQRVSDDLAFSIRGSYDLEGDIFQLDVPVYLISDSNLGLNAGVRARYVDDPDPDDLNEGLVFGIFVSKSFSLFR